jgi:phage-related tail protein
MNRAIEQSLYAQMQAAQDLEYQARDTLSQAQSAYAAARKSFRRAQAEWVNAHEQLEAQHAAPLRALAAVH